jgi:hypothetical protein
VLYLAAFGAPLGPLGIDGTLGMGYGSALGVYAVGADVGAFERYAAAFLQHGVDGQALVNLTCLKLKHTLHVTDMDHRRKIFDWIEHLMVASGSELPPQSDLGDARPRRLRTSLHLQSDHQTRVSFSEASSPISQSTPSRRPEARASSPTSPRCRPAEPAARGEVTALSQMRTLQTQQLQVLHRYVHGLRAQLHHSRQEWVLQMAATQEAATRSIMQLGQRLNQVTDTTEQLQQANRLLYNQVQELRGAIRVVCRVRPLLPTDKDAHLHSSVLVPDAGTLVVETRDFAGRTKETASVCKVCVVVGERSRITLGVGRAVQA